MIKCTWRSNGKKLLILTESSQPLEHQIFIFLCHLDNESQVFYHQFRVIFLYKFHQEESILPNQFFVNDIWRVSGHQSISLNHYQANFLKFLHQYF
jgi:hypothetical protein